MKFDILHEKFVRYFQSCVISNEWQIVPNHLVLLSQLLGTAPSLDPSNPSGIGMRVKLGPAQCHPRLSVFVIQNSGSGKGEALKTVLNIVRYFNIQTFMQRYGVTSEQEIPGAIERFKRARREMMEKYKTRTQAGPNESIVDVTQEIDADEEKTAPPDGTAAVEPDVAVKREYSMTNKEKIRVATQLERKEGKYWGFFEHDTSMTYPMTIQASTATKESLIGGYDTVPSHNGGVSRLWKPGMLETQAIYAWDEARNILRHETSEGQELNAMLCTALDRVGNVTTKARKDIDEFGNQHSFTTFTSIMTGTIWVEGLDASIASSGLIQRFMVVYKMNDADKALKMREDVAVNNVKTEDLDTMLKDYYQEFTKDPVCRSVVDFSPEALEYQRKMIHEEGMQQREMFAPGTDQFMLMDTLLARRTDVMKKIAALISALDNEPVVKKEYMAKAYELFGESAMQSLFAFVDDCAGNAGNAPAEKKDRACDYVLMNAIRERAAKGFMNMSHEELKDAVQRDPAWKRKGKQSTDTYIRKWASREVAIIKTEIINDTPFYSMRMATPEFEAYSSVVAKQEMDRLGKEQGLGSSPVVSGWAEMLKPKEPAKVEEEDVPEPTADDAAMVDGPLTKDKKKKKRAAGEKDET